MAPILRLALVLALVQLRAALAYTNLQCDNMGYYGAGSYVLPGSGLPASCNKCGMAFG